MVERKLRPAPSTLHLLPSRKPARTGPSHSTKLFVLDTNVLMHDPTSLFRFEEHDIYLPILTLEELDAHKKGMTEVARNARQASRFLDELVTAHTGPGTDGITGGIPLTEKSGGAATGRLFLQTEAIAAVLPPSLANGKTVMETAPTIEWGYLIYLTVLRLCQYFGAKEECGFCDINHNWRQHKREGRPYTGVKPVADVLEALALIDRYDTGQVSKAYTLTGGSVTSTVDGLAEADFYGRYAQAIEERFPKRWIGKVVAQALPREDVQRYKDYGITIYHPNYEVWDKRLFSLISPGKERYVGREEWHRRILDAADVFGPANVIPNFVAGVELARPFGFESIDAAIASTVEGLDYFMGHGVTPRFTTWCPEPTTPLGRDNPDGAPLEYHVRLLGAYREALARNGLQAPPGYGEPGVGKAIFAARMRHM